MQKLSTEEESRNVAYVIIIPWWKHYEIPFTVEVICSILVVDYALIWIKLWEFALHIKFLWRLYWQGWDTSYLIADTCVEDNNLISLQLLEKIKHFWDVIYQIFLDIYDGSLILSYLFLCGVEFSVQTKRILTSCLYDYCLLWRFFLAGRVLI